MWGKSAALCLLVCLPARARGDGDPWFAPDKALHFGVSAAAGGGGYATAALWSERRTVRALAGGLLAVGLGAGKELADLAGAGDPSWRDFTWDLIGGATGVALAWGIDQLFFTADPADKERRAAEAEVVGLEAMKHVIATPLAPAAIGPYSQAITVPAGELIFCSGQIALDPATGKIVEGGVEAETRLVLSNLLAVLTAAGASSTEVVRTTIFLVDLNDFAAVNRLYGEVFKDLPPARATVQVAALPRGARVEIDAIAVRAGRESKR